MVLADATKLRDEIRLTWQSDDSHKTAAAWRGSGTAQRAQLPLEQSQGLGGGELGSLNSLPCREKCVSWKRPISLMGKQNPITGTR